MYFIVNLKITMPDSKANAQQDINNSPLTFVILPLTDCDFSSMTALLTAGFPILTACEKCSLHSIILLLFYIFFVHE
jgi:hypothetical protein